MNGPAALPTIPSPSGEPSGRVVLFGDVGGQLEAFVEHLEALGCDTGSGHVPDDMTIIQVGDLVHRGPDSLGCLQLVDRFIGSGSGRWIQLVGNHEAHEIGGPMMAGFEHDVSPAGREILQRWWHRGDIHIAAALDVEPLGPMLAVHGGVTPWLYQTLGSPGLSELVEMLNSTVGSSGAVFNPGIMLGPPDPADLAVGPVWAESTFEVYMPWLMTGGAPFGQIHGHSSPVSWTKNNEPFWRREVPQEVRDTLDRTDDANRHSHFVIAGRHFIAIDPGHGRRPADRWGPLMLRGTIHL